MEWTCHIPKTASKEDAEAAERAWAFRVSLIRYQSKFINVGVGYEKLMIFSADARRLEYSRIRSSVKRAIFLKLSKQSSQRTAKKRVGNDLDYRNSLMKKLKLLKVRSEPDPRFRGIYRSVIFSTVTVQE